MEEYASNFPRTLVTFVEDQPGKFSYFRAQPFPDENAAVRHLNRVIFPEWSHSGFDAREGAYWARHPERRSARFVIYPGHGNFPEQLTA